MLIKIVNGLPGLVDEKGEMNQKLLASLVSISEALEKLKNSEEKQIIIPGELGDKVLYELVKKSESDKQVSETKDNSEKELEDSREKIKFLEELRNQLLEEIRVLTGEEKGEIEELKK
jgi:hypothetical protein